MLEYERNVCANRLKSKSRLYRQEQSYFELSPLTI